MSTNINRTPVTLYTDGSCLGNGKEFNRGGWAAILTFGDKEKVLRGSQQNTKNNRMELTAAIEGIKALKRPCDVTIVTDSQYVCRCFASCREWYLNGWRNKSGNKPANVDLLSELMEVGKQGKHHFKFQYVEGHAGHPYNERCDKIAREQASKVQIVSDKPVASVTYEDAIAALEGRC